ncbi:hypothetical protein [Halomicronema hongdechloris]|nr:hypothetical protein [Halomicronema hongdechloris]
MFRQIKAKVPLLAMVGVGALSLGMAMALLSSLGWRRWRPDILGLP